MLHYYSADWIFPVSSAPIQNGVVEVHDTGEISRLLTMEEYNLLNLPDLIKLDGALVPGFVNTHCHLELSHMQNQVPEKTGLVAFVQSIIQSRGAEEATILEAMQKADQQMFDQGIVAVGDISNQIFSKPIKEKSPIYYHTFVEAMGFNPARADVIMENSIRIKNEFAPLKASVVPHAPYSVSPELFTLICKEANEKKDLLTIHNQESQAENDFFTEKSGDFLKLYAFLGLEISFFKPTGKSALKSYLPQLEHQKLLLVHNTFSTKADVDFARQQDTDIFWCLCPGANLYIENTLPDVALLMREGVKITLGTDSLASNDQLNILKEMQILQSHLNLPFEQLLLWATLNGAEFLGLSNRFGTLEAGKRPGLNLIQLSADFTILNDRVQKII